MAFSLEIEYAAAASTAAHTDDYDFAMSFTTDGGFDCTKISIYGKRVSGGIGEPLNVAIKAVDGSHKPTGDAVCSGSISSIGDISTDEGWIEIEMDSPGTLSGVTEYIIVTDKTTADVIWYGDAAGDYADGMAFYSTDNQSSWGGPVTADLYFRIYSGSSPSYSELAGTITGAGSGSGDLDLDLELTGTIAGVGGGSGDLGSVLVSVFEAGLYKRLVAAGNDRIYYEDI